MEIDVLRSQLKGWAQGVSRTAWIPLVEEGDSELVVAKFGGAPALLAEEGAPTCGHCKRELRLFVQLNLDDLPDGAVAQPAQHTLQLFYCQGDWTGADDGFDECWGEDGWEPFNDVASRCRIVPTDALTTRPSQPTDMAAKRIISWVPMVDAPHANELERLGLETKYDFAAKTARFISESIGLDATVAINDFQIEEVATAAEGDKLRGWPCWIQGREFPSCPACGLEMEQLFQVDSEVNVDYMFGDSGIGHISQCPTHREVVGFGWACS